MSQMIIDRVDGKHYHGNQQMCELLNRESDRADRNAELLDVDCVATKRFCDDVMRIMRKYEIEDLEKLDEMLFQQKVW